MAINFDLFYPNREKPLALYAFTSDKSVKEKLTTRTSSGAISFNDVLVHFSGKNNYCVLREYVMKYYLSLYVEHLISLAV